MSRAGRSPAAQADERRVIDGVEVILRRSARRRRTSSARREGGAVLVMLPAGLQPDVEEPHVRSLVQRVLRQEQRRTTGRTDADLGQRAARLAREYLGGSAQPSSIRWVSNQGTRWGSCTPSTGAIRISDRLAAAPDRVVDAVVLHELAHLIEPNHSGRFWALVEAYPHHEWAKGWLEGCSAGLGTPAGPSPGGSESQL